MVRRGASGVACHDVGEKLHSGLARYEMALHGGSHFD